jgi:3-hydroxyisobutyrate dehydrogenase-like beta-hydroxyacid dehydrogenase
MNPDPLKIAFLGIGVMGGPMCANLARSGAYDVVAFDIDVGKVDRLAEHGVITAQSIAGAVTGADLVMTSLPGPKEVDAVAFEDDGLFASIQPGAAWIDLSTNNLEVCGRIEKEAAQQGIEFLDCPVSGGDKGAAAGTLTILVGGHRPSFEKFLSVLEVIGSNITYLGVTGAGYSAKISQVVLCYLHSLALSEALMLGVKGGVEPAKMLDIIQNSTASSYVADHYGPPILAGDYDPSFTLGLALKDMRLAEEMAASLGITLPMCDLTTQTYSRAVEQYGFDANHLKAVRLLEEDNQTWLRDIGSA